jgi:hypothetical protein
MSYFNQLYTIHTEEHTEPIMDCDFCEDIKFGFNRFRNNLFSANHRNRMIQRYEYTEAQWLTIEDLI